MKKECGCDSKNKKQCKSCYDRERWSKIKKGSWKFNKPMPSKLTKQQKEILIGGLLGDFYLYQHGRAKNAGIAVVRTVKDLDYLKFEFEAFKEFCSELGIKRRDSSFSGRKNEPVNKGVAFRTRMSPVFTKFRKQWYPKGKKIIPKTLKLSPLICAIWFCDDGSIQKKRWKSNENKFTLIISLYTDGFTKKEVQFLKKLLDEKLKTNAKLTHRKGKNNADKKRGWMIRLNSEDAKKFIRYIKDVIPKSMSRKSDVWKGIVK